MPTYHANTGRLEREMITASMPSPQQPSMYRPGGQDGVVAPKTGASDASPRVILPLLPHISREPTHQDLGADSNRVDPGCMYSPGDALYSNSAIVIARLAEIKQAGTEFADLGLGESRHFSTNSAANQDGGIESSSDSTRSFKDNGQSPVDAEVMTREGGVAASDKDGIHETEEDSPDKTGRASDQSGRRPPRLTALSPPIEAIPNRAASSGVIPPSSRRW